MGRSLLLRLQRLTRPAGDRPRSLAAVWRDLDLKVLNAVHHSLLHWSGGRLGWRAGGMHVLELTTIGRKSGLCRSVVLTSPIQEGDTWVIVAGSDHNPGWFVNLRERPDVEVSRKGKPNQPMRARIATPEERERLWPQAVAVYKGYAAHQRKTDREIPLVLLSPRG